MVQLYYQYLAYQWRVIDFWLINGVLSISGLSMAQFVINILIQLSSLYQIKRQLLVKYSKHTQNSAYFGSSYAYISYNLMTGIDVSYDGSVA